MLTDDGSGNTRYSYLLWFVIASVLFFIITRMIADSSLKVFHLSSLKKFGVYLIAAAVFCAFSVFDVTGIENHLPKASNVKSVSIASDTLTVPSSVVLEDQDSVQTAINLQEAILHEKDIRQDVDGTTTVTLIYTMKNGNTMARSYTCGLSPAKFKESESQLRKLASLDEFKQKNQLRIPAEKAGCELWMDDSNSKQLLVKDINGLVDAYNADIRAMDYEALLGRQASEDEHTYAVDLYYSDRFTTLAADEENEDWGYYTFNSSFKNTINYLKEKGYLEG